MTQHFLSSVCLLNVCLTASHVTRLSIKQTAAVDGLEVLSNCQIPLSVFKHVSSVSFFFFLKRLSFQGYLMLQNSRQKNHRGSSKITIMFSWQVHCCKLCTQFYQFQCVMQRSIIESLNSVLFCTKQLVSCNSLYQFLYLHKHISVNIYITSACLFSRNYHVDMFKNCFYCFLLVQRKFTESFSICEDC